MKNHLLILAILSMIFLNACLVKSLHPFYKESETIFKPNLLGTWADGDSGIWTISQFSYSKGFMKGDTLDNSYLLELIEKDDSRSVLHGHLFKLDGTLYMDFFPIMSEHFEDELHSFHLLPTHSIARIRIEGASELNVEWFDEEWLTELFEENRVNISHEVVRQTSEIPDVQGKYTNAYILTASTVELQKFLRKYGSKLQAQKDSKTGMFSEGFVANLKRVDE